MRPLPAVVALFVIATPAAAQPPVPVPQVTPAPSAPAHQEGSAAHGMVAAANPLAVATGVAVLKAGGNAVDAAVAVQAVLGLV